MENLIKEVFEKKMKDGSIEAIIESQIEQLVKSSLNDLFSYRGVIREQLEAKLKDVMGNVLEHSDFSAYVTKLTTLINTVLPETSVAEYKNICNNLKQVLGSPQLKISGKFDLETILCEYVKYIENVTFDRDCVDVRDGEEALITCHLDIYKDTGSYFDKIYMKLYITGVDESEAVDYKKIYTLRKSYSGNEMELCYSNFTGINTTDLKYLSSFELYMLNLANHYCKFSDCHEQELEAEAYVEIE